MFAASRVFRRWKNILAIETSCDDTSVCVLDHSTSFVVFHETIRQDAIHAPHGGIVPRLASLNHRKNLPGLLKKATKDISFDYVAATRGPGIGSSLAVGWSAALIFSIATNRPLIPIHHMEGHLLMPFFHTRKLPAFPFLTLLVSGGHTMWVEVTDIGSYRILGATLDDSIGDAFDKGGRTLGLEWSEGLSYGAVLEKMASQASDELLPLFPRPLMKSKAPDFSFSGLKTALEKLVLKLENKTNISALASAFQSAIIRHVIDSMKKVPGFPHKYSALIVSGGVARNSQLLAKLRNASSIPVVAPASEYCSDNALMIANAASLRLTFGKPINLEQKDAHEYYPRWALDSLS